MTGHGRLEYPVLRSLEYLPSFLVLNVQHVGVFFVGLGLPLPRCMVICLFSPTPRLVSGSFARQQLALAGHPSQALQEITRDG